MSYLRAIATALWFNVFGSRGPLRPLKKSTAKVVEANLDQSVCAELVKRIDAMCDGGAHPRIWRDDVGSDTRILGFERDIPDLVEHFGIEDRLAEVSRYLGLRINSWFLMANRTEPRPGNLGSGGGLHRDSPFSHQVKFIWYLSDVGPDNGPFQFVPGTHMSSFRDRSKYPIGETRFADVDDELQEVCASAGSLLVCDTKCIHGGKPIASGARHAVTLYTHTDRDAPRRIFTAMGLQAEAAA